MEQAAKRIKKASRGSTWDDADIDKSPIVERLKATRLALGYKYKSNFAKSAGIHPPAYNVFENPDVPKRIITIGQAIKLCDRHNLTLDWIYRDKLYGLPGDLRVKIEAELNKLRRRT